MSVTCIRSEGDLEVVLLHEAHGALAELIGAELYSVGGIPPEQSVLFHTRSTFNHFLVLLVEFFAEGVRSAYIDEKFQNWSLLKALNWFCKKYKAEAGDAGLTDAVGNLTKWVEKEVALTFWCPDVSKDIALVVRNDQLISFGSNTAKHHLLRLADLLGKLEGLCTKGGYDFSPQELAAVLSSMVEEVRSRLMYHSTHLLELLGIIFLALNAVIQKRFGANATNCVSGMTMPPGITSDVFRDLYGSVLVFKRYEDERIRAHTPVTRHLKLRY